MKKKIMFLTVYIFLGLLITSCGGGGGGGNVATQPGNVSHIPGGIDKPKDENPIVTPGDEHGDHGSSIGNDHGDAHSGGGSSQGGGSGSDHSSGDYGESQGGESGESQGGSSSGTGHGPSGGQGSGTDEIHTNYDNPLNLSRTQFKYIDNQQLPDIPGPANRPKYIIGITDADFITHKTDMKNRYNIEIIEDLPHGVRAPNGDKHGTYVIKVINLNGDENFKVVAGSFGEVVFDGRQNLKAVRPSADIYKKAMGFFGDQKVKIFNNSWGANYDDNNYPTINSRNFKRLLMSDDDEALVEFYKDAVNNKGGLFIWSAGNSNRIQVNGQSLSLIHI